MSFFGQKTAVILDSSDWSDPYVFLRFLKKKQDGQWEKPSQKEGKALKINLLEMVAMLEVLANRSPKWQTMHKYQDESTSISMERQGNDILLMITGYAKPLKGPEVKIFWDLLSHIYEEKIANATSSKNGNEIRAESVSTPEDKNNVPTEVIGSPKKPEPAKKAAPPKPKIQEEPVEFEDPEFANPFDQDSPSDILNNSNGPKYNPEEWLNALKTQDDFKLVPGEVVSKSPKAISFQIMNLKQIWVPSSCVNPMSAEGGLWIKNWFLEKKLTEIFS
jgi:hypothetical protein